MLPEYFIKQETESKFWVCKCKYLQWKQKPKKDTDPNSKQMFLVTHLKAKQFMFSISNTQENNSDAFQKAAEKVWTSVCAIGSIIYKYLMKVWNERIMTVANKENLMDQ